MAPFTALAGMKAANYVFNNKICWLILFFSTFFMLKSFSKNASNPFSCHHSFYLHRNAKKNESMILERAFEIKKS